MSNANFIIAPSNLSIFSNSLLNDTLIYTNSSNMRLGNTVNTVAPLNITSNAIYTSNVNMGINNSNPQYALDVIGKINIKGSIGYSNYSFQYISNPVSGAIALGGSGTMSYSICNSSFQTNGTGPFTYFTVPVSGLWYFSANHGFSGGSAGVVRLVIATGVYTSDLSGQTNILCAAEAQNTGNGWFGTLNSNGLSYVTAGTNIYVNYQFAASMTAYTWTSGSTYKFQGYLISSY